MPKNQFTSTSSGKPGDGSSARQPAPRRNPGLTPHHELTRKERERRVNRGLAIAMASLAVLVVLILTFGWWREVVARSSEPVASVAGESISIDAYAKRLDFQRKAIEQQLAFYQAQLQSSGADQAIADLYRQQIQQVQFALMLLPDQVLESLIEEKLVRQEAARRGIQVTPEEIEAEIASTFGQQAAPEPEPTAEPQAGGAEPAPSPTAVPTVDPQARFTEFLTLYGISGAEYRSIVEAQLLYEKLGEAMGQEVPAVGEQVHARHILVDTEEKAKEIQERLRNGESFEDLAKAESIDSGSKESGGDLGWFPRGVMVEGFEQTAFELPLNQVSEPVNSTFGWHLIEVLEKEADRPVEEGMLSNLRAGVISRWLEEAGQSQDVTRDLTEEDKNWVYEQIQWRPAL